MHARWSVILLLSACVSRSAPSSTQSCSDDAPVPPPAAVRTVAGYPMPRVTLTPQEVDERRAERQALVPGWSVTVSPNGNVVSVETTDAVGPEARISPERVRRFQEMLLALGYSAQTSRVSSIRGYLDTVMFDDAWVGRQEPVPGSTGQVRLRVDFPDVPVLPPGVRELTDEELHARWGDNWQKRQVSVDVSVAGQPCDLAVGTSGGCAGTGPQSSRECMALGKLDLARRVSEGPDGFRHVFGVRAFEQGHGMHLSYYAPVSLCLDAVTGEGLPLERCLDPGR